MSHQARAAVFTAPDRQLQFRQFPVPQPQGDEVLVRVVACTLCGSDLHTYLGRRVVPVPTILGHEILGRIAAFGPTARRYDAAGRALSVGDRVTWSLVASCGDCFYCRRRLPQKCERMVKYGHEPLTPGRELTGGLAEYCLLAPGTALLQLSDALSDEAACPANCATATAAAALGAHGDLRQQRVLVVGAGMLGLAAAAMARHRGAAEVVCVDVDAARLARAEAFGATRLAGPADVESAVRAATEGRGVDVALELSGAPEGFETALAQLRLGGTLLAVGAVFPSRPVPLAVEQVVRRNLTLRGIHNYAPDDLRAAVEFLSQAAQYPFASLVAQWLPLGAAAEAFRLARQPGVLRVGVRPTD